MPQGRPLPADRLHADRLPWALLAAASLGMFAASASGTTRAPFLIEMAQDLDTSLVLVGNLVAGTSITWGLASAFAGALSDKLGRRPFLIGGPVALALSMIGVATAGSFVAVACWAMLAGACSGMFSGAIFAEVSSRAGDGQQGRALGWVMSGQSLTLLVGVPLAAFVGSWIGWRGVNICVAAMALLSAASLLWTTRGRVSSARVRGTRAPSLRTALSLPVIRLLGMGIMERICYGLTAVFFATFLQQTYGLALHDVALPLAIFASGNILGTILGGQLADKLPNRARTYAVAMVASGGAALALFGWQESLAVSVGLGFVYVFLNAIARPAMLASLATVPEQVRGTVMGLNVTCSSIGWMGASGLGGLMVATQGFGGFGPLTAVVAAMGAGLAVVRR